MGNVPVNVWHSLGGRWGRRHLSCVGGGRSDKVPAASTYIIDGDGFVGGADLLLIARASAQPTARAGAQASNDRPPSARDIVQVTGTVRLFDAGAFRNDYGLDLREGVVRAWAGKPAVIATAVSPPGR